jgi:hypothetical protein
MNRDMETRLALAILAVALICSLLALAFGGASW